MNTVSWEMGDGKPRPSFAARYGSQYTSYDDRYRQELELHRDTKFSLSLKDRRSTSEYIYDLIDGFLIEDRIEALLADAGIEFKSSGGAGAGHVILPSSRVTQHFDYKLLGNHPVDLEVLSTNNDRIPLHLKQWKVQRATSRTVFLFYIKPRDLYYLVDARTLQQTDLVWFSGLEAWCHPLDADTLGPQLSLDQVQQLLKRRLNDGQV